MALAEKQRQTAEDFVAGYNIWTIEGLLAWRSKDCIHRIRPASLEIPDLDNKQWEEQMRQLLPLVTNYKMTVVKVFNDPEARTVVLHATATADAVVGPYRNEYVFFLKMNETGDEIVEVEEHTDSAFVTSWFPKIREHME